MTSTRSARPSTSGTSLETSSTPTPWAASPRITWYSSARAPTSTPRVGSSSSSSRVSPSSQRPTTTFCWLPPDSVRTGRRTSRGRRSRRLGDPGRLGPLLAGVGEADRGVAGEGGQRHVAVDRLAEQQRLALALLGRHAHAGPYRGADTPGRSALPFMHDPARLRPARAEDGLQQLGAAGADQAGDADDLAGVDGQRDVGELAGAGSGPRTRSSSARPRLGASARSGKTYSMVRPVIRLTRSRVGRGRGPAGSPRWCGRP